MRPNPTESIVPGPRQFEATQWTLVLTAGGGTEAAKEALGQLCSLYWYPLYAFVRRQGFPAEDAQDLTQEFFLRLIEKQWLEDVGREKGRFRSWLLASMNHFLANEWDRRKTLKRGRGIMWVPIHADAETRYAHELADAVTPEILFDRRWALTVLELVMCRLRQEFVAAGKEEQFEALKGALTGDRTPYAELARRLETSEGAIKIGVHRLRSRYRALLAEQITQTVASASEVEDELRHLYAALRG